ncbi:MAG TPA: hypothetical protein VFJ58_24520 [Armatimonadota bacterium]|nr:hypothetical protein [Armatimonadota bacterium]
MHAIPRTWILQTAAIGLLTLFLALAKPCQGRAVVHPRYAAARVEEVLGSVGAESAMKKITWYTPSAAWFDVVGEGSGFGTLVTSRRPLKVTVLMLDTQKKQVMEVPGTAKGTASFPQYIDKQNPGDFKEFKAEQARHQVHTSQEHAGPLKSIGTVEYLGLRCRILRRVYSGERGNTGKLSGSLDH